MNLFAFIVLSFSKIIPLVYALIGFGLLIAVHEFGHFIFCKIFKIHTPTFSIGMGPKIFQKQIGETNFVLSAFPLGGYVEIAGLAEVGQGDQKHSKDLSGKSFQQKPYWQRILVLLGGIIFNVFFSYTVYTVLFATGMPETKSLNFVIQSVVKNSAAEKYDLRPEDSIIGVNNYEFSSTPRILFKETQEQFLSAIKGYPGGKLKVTLLRGGKKVTKTIILKERYEDNKKIGSLGIVSYFKPGPIEIVKHSIPKSFCEGAKKIKSDILFIAYSIKTFITQKSLKGAGGPIMILSQSSKIVKKGIKKWLRFLALISVNLAFINLLPIGALDGGQVVFETIEAVIRRRLPEIIRNTINIASWIAILSLIALLSYNDILSLFKH
jgi:regulator of sigma E protease